MDASKFQSARDSQLKSFQSQYSALKGQYTTAVGNALKEKDNSTRSTLTAKVLDLNNQITALINGFVGTVDIGTCKQNPSLRSTLSADLDKFTADYENIRQGTSQLTALGESIKVTTKKSAETQSWFSWYNGGIILAVIVLIIIIVTRMRSSSSLNTQSSMSVVPGSQ
jgi:hypothetical protein